MIWFFVVLKTVACWKNDILFSCVFNHDEYWITIFTDLTHETQGLKDLYYIVKF